MELNPGGPSYDEWLVGLNPGGSSYDEWLVGLNPGGPSYDEWLVGLNPGGSSYVGRRSLAGNATTISVFRPEIFESIVNHFNDAGEARMVDVSDKLTTKRVAVARAGVTMSPSSRQTIESQSAPKGDVLSIARLAGIMAAKQTANLIPLCHTIPIESVSVDFEWTSQRLEILATVSTSGKTGVEMEAMTAASVAALTVYDMLKSVDRWISIGPVELVRKSGGKSGDLRRD